MSRAVVKTVLVLISLLASPANALLLFDTFPAPGRPLGPAYGVYANFDWQEIALPFTITATTHVTVVETALTYGAIRP